MSGKTDMLDQIFKRQYEKGLRLLNQYERFGCEKIGFILERYGCKLTAREKWLLKNDDCWRNQAIIAQKLNVPESKIYDIRRKAEAKICAALWWVDCFGTDSSNREQLKEQILIEEQRYLSAHPGVMLYEGFSYLPLPGRVVNALKRKDITTLKQLLVRVAVKNKLQQIPGIGTGSYQETVNILVKEGLLPEGFEPWDPMVEYPPLNQELQAFLSINTFSGQ